MTEAKCDQRIADLFTNRMVSNLSPPGKRRKLRDERSKPDIWNRRFQNPIRQENVEQFKPKVNAYE